MHLDHVHFSPDSSYIHPPFPTHPTLYCLFLFLITIYYYYIIFKPIKYSLCWPYTFGCVAFTGEKSTHRSLKTDSLFPNYNHPPIAPWLRVELTAHFCLHARILSFLTLYRACAYRTSLNSYVLPLYIEATLFPCSCLPPMAFTVFLPSLLSFSQDLE